MSVTKQGIIQEAILSSDGGVVLKFGPGGQHTLALHASEVPFDGKGSMTQLTPDRLEGRKIVVSYTGPKAARIVTGVSIEPLPQPEAAPSSLPVRPETAAARAENGDLQVARALLHTRHG